MPDPVWEARAAGFRYSGAGPDAVADVDCAIAAGQLTALIGPNGAGKSTFARLLIGLAAPTRGAVLYRGRPAAAWPREAMAREVGFVPQGEETAFPLRVREVVAMGRYPHLGPWRAEGADDRRVIREALVHVEAEELATRRFDSLSGGERQRVRIARALAQEGEALVLDEPSAGLDIRHEVELFVLCARLAAAGRTVVVVTHNLGLAARLAQRVLLFDRSRLAIAGPPQEVLTADTLTRVYGWPVDVIPHPGPGAEAGTPLVFPRIDRSATGAA
jgi:ABC-type cobalamin/Fe3+-siderophores transport system ATPase subunit